MRSIYVFPLWPADNPYQNMLHLGALAAGWRVFGGTKPHQLHAAAKGLRAGDILHLHWTHPICQKQPDRRKARQELNQFKRTLRELTARGVAIVWTVHNTIPHDTRYLELEIELGNFIVEHATRIIQLNEHTREAVAEFYDLPSSKLVTLRHASYLGIHEPMPKETARDLLGVPPGAPTVAFIGRIEPYKGVDALLSATQLLVHEIPDLTLLLAGRADPADAEQVEARLPAGVRTIRFYDFIPGDQLSSWFSAADVIALPYRQVLNSGSVLLAATMGRACVLPDEPHLVGQYGDQPWMYFFERTQNPAVALAHTLRSALQHADESGAAARAYASEYTTLDMSRDYLHIIEDLENR